MPVVPQTLALGLEGRILPSSAYNSTLIILCCPACLRSRTEWEANIGAANTLARIAYEMYFKLRVRPLARSPYTVIIWTRNYNKTQTTLNLAH